MNSFSTTYAAVIINLLVTFLPRFGVQASTDEVTGIVQAAVALGTGIWILVQRYKKGDVTAAGLRK